MMFAAAVTMNAVQSFGKRKRRPINVPNKRPINIDAAKLWTMTRQSVDILVLSLGDYISERGTHGKYKRPELITAWGFTNGWI